ncbi:MAG: transglycosylase SLT domain-containing protein [Cellvibrionaceae bacterium]
MSIDAHFPLFSPLNIKCLLLLACVSILSACTTSPPRQLNNVCSIFEEKGRWYKDAKKAEENWRSPIPTMMAIMHQESRFRAKAKPPRTKILWVIPWTRPSNAYGYPQALDSTWSWYRKSTGNWGADRDDFGDAIDFIGWYNAQTHKVNRVRLDDTYRLYLAYHEGHGGFKRKTYQSKAWLKTVANKVAHRATNYKKQLQGCEKKLSKGFSLWPF